MSEDSGTLLELRGVHKYFGDRHILRGIDLEIQPHTVTCVIGPSGAGKTTLLRSMNMLTLIDSGEMRLRGKSVIITNRVEVKSPAMRWLRRLLSGDGRRFHSRRELYVEPHLYRRSVGMVLQDYNLWPQQTVIQNLIKAPTHILGESGEAARARAVAVLRQVHLPDEMDAFPYQLSGGQRQRVAIARALMMNSQILLLDEITSALDPELVGEVLLILRELASQGVTMVLVTHHMHFASLVADQVVMLEQGVVVERGTAADVLHNPKNERTHRFLEALSQAPLRVGFGPGKTP